MTGNHPKIIGVNLFKIIETLYNNKAILEKNPMYLNELCQLLHREYKDVKVDVVYLSSLGYAVTDFIEDTVNQRLTYLTPKSTVVMDREISPKNYDEFIKMSENPETDVGGSVNFSDKESKLKRAFRFLKSN
ncbi:MAG: hypothetical protein ACW9W9_03570 [Candidatus Nitrosopumilus sp. Bin_571-38]